MPQNIIDYILLYWFVVISQRHLGNWEMSIYIHPDQITQLNLKKKPHSVNNFRVKIKNNKDIEWIFSQTLQYSLEIKEFYVVYIKHFQDFQNHSKNNLYLLFKHGQECGDGR